MNNYGIRELFEKNDNFFISEMGASNMFLN